MSGSSLKTDDSDQEQCYEHQTQRRNRFLEQKDAYDHGTQSTDSCPDGVRSAKGQCFSSLGQKQETEESKTSDEETPDYIVITEVVDSSEHKQDSNQVVDGVAQTLDPDLLNEILAQTSEVENTRFMSRMMMNY